MKFNKLTKRQFAILIGALVLIPIVANAGMRQYSMTDLDKAYENVSNDGNFVFSYNQEKGLISENALFTTLFNDTNCHSLLFPVKRDTNISSRQERMDDLKRIKEQYAQPCLNRLNENLKQIWEDWEFGKDAQGSVRSATPLNDDKNNGKICKNFEEDDIPYESRIYNYCFQGDSNNMKNRIEMTDDHHVVMQMNNIKEYISPTGTPLAFVINKNNVEFFLETLNSCDSGSVEGLRSLVQKYNLPEITVAHTDDSLVYNISLVMLEHINSSRGVKNENCIFTAETILDNGPDTSPNTVAIRYWTIGTDDAYDRLRSTQPGGKLWLILIKVGIVLLVTLMILLLNKSTRSYLIKIIKFKSK